MAGTTLADEEFAHVVRLAPLVSVDLTDAEKREIRQLVAAIDAED